MNRSFISPRDTQKYNDLSKLRDDGIIINKSNAEADPNLILEKYERTDNENTLLGLVSGENKETRETAKALWGTEFDKSYKFTPNQLNEENMAAVTSEEFDKGYEFIPNPSNEKETVTVTSATTEECCKFLLEMAGGEFLDDGVGDY